MESVPRIIYSLSENDFCFSCKSGNQKNSQYLSGNSNRYTMQGRTKHSFIELQTQDTSLENEPDIKKSVNGFTSNPFPSEDSDAFALLSTEKSGITEVESGSGIPSAIFNLTTTIIGAGIIGLPATMKVLGLPLCFAVIVLMGIL